MVCVPPPLKTRISLDSDIDDGEEGMFDERSWLIATDDFSGGVVRIPGFDMHSWDTSDSTMDMKPAATSDSSFPPP
jgi:hypothetical protein